MEIIQKKSSLQSSKGLKILFYISLIFLFFSIVGFFVLNNFLKNTKKEFETLEITLAKEIAPEKLTLKREVLSYQEKIDNFSFLIDQQKKNSKFFEAFEKIIHPQVWFSEFSLDSKEKTVTLSGHAQNFEALGQQLLIIKNEYDWIKNFSLKAISINKEGKIDFNLNLFLIPTFLND